QPGTTADGPHSRLAAWHREPAYAFSLIPIREFTARAHLHIICFHGDRARSRKSGSLTRNSSPQMGTDLMMINTNFEPAGALIDSFGEDDDCDDDAILISAAEILSSGRSGSTGRSRLLPGLTLFDSAQPDWAVAAAAAQPGHGNVALGQAVPSNL